MLARSLTIILSGTAFAVRVRRQDVGNGGLYDDQINSAPDEPFLPDDADSSPAFEQDNSAVTACSGGAGTETFVQPGTTIVETEPGTTFAETLAPLPTSEASGGGTLVEPTPYPTEGASESEVPTGGETLVPFPTESVPAESGTGAVPSEPVPSEPAGGTSAVESGMSTGEPSPSATYELPPPVTTAGAGSLVVGKAGLVGVLVSTFVIVMLFD